MSDRVELRKRVVKFVRKGNRSHQANNLFEVHYNTVKSWVKIYPTEGRLITPGQTAQLKPDKLDREALRREVQEPPDSFQSEPQTLGVVQSTISKAFQQRGITRKKTEPLRSGQ